ncbi:Mu transposase C-terminal domain-containing protein, partial [Paraburkholderia azotifigens]|uniref:Mu transposase C-terminal domain-containing protein n=1 Tax=Paraburkholderia azotifigens TaxID=2057004 RepID=UPI00317A4CB3
SSWWSVPALAGFAGCAFDKQHSQLNRHRLLKFPLLPRTPLSTITRLLGPLAAQLDELFWHRVARHVRRDGTVSYQNRRFEVPYELTGQTVMLVVDPPAGTVVRIESQTGEPLGAATALDVVANSTRRRRRAQPEPVTHATTPGPNLLELVHQRHYREEA